MTGKGLGFCILKIPNSFGEPFVGFAGKSGTPVSFSADESKADTELTALPGQTRATPDKTGVRERRAPAYDKADDEA
jgi:hypothetical protein